MKYLNDVMAVCILQYMENNMERIVQNGFATMYLLQIFYFSHMLYHATKKCKKCNNEDAYLDVPCVLPLEVLHTKKLCLLFLRPKIQNTKQKHPLYCRQSLCCWQLGQQQKRLPSAPHTAHGGQKCLQKLVYSSSGKNK